MELKLQYYEVSGSNATLLIAPLMELKFFYHP